MKEKETAPAVQQAKVTETSKGQAESSKDHDVVLLHSRTEDGRGIRALRSRPSRLELTEIRPVKQGQPITGGELVRLKPREESPLLCDVEVDYDASQADGEAHDGPPRVSSGAYRRNWDAVFGRSKRRNQLN